MIALKSPAITRAVPHSRPFLGNAEAMAVTEALSEALVARGARVTVFEAALAAHVGLPFAFATASGTEALVLALHTVGVVAGDDVVLPTYVCDSIAAAVRRVGARPVLCDSGPDWVMTAATVRQVITRRTRAVIAVHILGLRCDLDALAAEVQVPIIEDACQAFALAGQSSAAACSVLSFHATKCLTTGEGGAILTRDVALAARIHEAIDWGQASVRLSDINAAIGLVQLERHDAFIQRRREIASRYDASFPAELTARWQKASRGGSAWFRYPLWLEDLQFDDARRATAKQGVSLRRGVDSLLHRRADQPDSRFPGAVECFEHTCSVPLWPAMSDDDATHVINTVLEHVAR